MKIDQLVECCIKRGYVSEAQAPWLRYALNKYIPSLLTTLPILIFASYLATPITACSFYCSFCWLRVRTNGIHAKTVVGCFCSSLVCVFVFMGILYRLLTACLIQVFLLLSFIIIWFLAPFNHPNMHLTDTEKTACMNSARTRLLLLILGAGVLQKLNSQEAFSGIVLGVSMTALLLALAYSRKGEGGEK